MRALSSAATAGVGSAVFTCTMRVLIVEDEPDLAAAVATGLRAEGFDVDVSHDGLDGLWRAREFDYALVVLDILMPGMNGYQVCRTLREEGSTVPILMLTAKSGECDEAEAFDIGADDFLAKPFSFVVLVAAGCGRCCVAPVSPEHATYRIGSLELDPLRRICTRGGVHVALDGTRDELARGADARSRRHTFTIRAARRGLGSRLPRRLQRRRGLRAVPAGKDRSALRVPLRREHPGHRISAGARRPVAIMTATLPGRVNHMLRARNLSVRLRLAVGATALFLLLSGLTSVVIVRGFVIASRIVCAPTRPRRCSR